MRVGSIVILQVPILGNNKLTIGVCYETYNTGASFIFENGEFDGFSLREQNEFLHKTNYHLLLEDYGYKFENVIQLDTDYRRGQFDSALRHNDGMKSKIIKDMRDSKIDSIV